MASPQYLWSSPSTANAVAYIVRALFSSLLALVLIWTFKFRGGVGFAVGKLFNWHPLLMLLSFPVLMTEALLAYRSHPVSQLQRPTIKGIHAGIHTLSLLCAGGGLAAILLAHHLPEDEKPDFIFPHGWIGIAALALFSLQFLLGGVIYLCPGIPISAKKNFSEIHGFLGLVTYYVGLAATMTGLVENTAHLLANNSIGPVVDIPRASMILLLAIGILVGYLYGFQKNKVVPCSSSNSMTEPLVII